MKDDEQLDLVFKALGDGTRRRILAMVAEQDVRVTDIAEPFEMSLNAVSKHLMVLENAGLLTRTKDGRVHRCRMNPEPLQPALDLIRYYRSFWEGQLDKLEVYLEKQMQRKEGDK